MCLCVWEVFTFLAKKSMAWKRHHNRTHRLHCNSTHSHTPNYANVMGKTENEHKYAA